MPKTAQPRPISVVLMAYGTPRSREEILPYYTDIRRGRPPTPEQLADLTRRYDALGGTSPLAARTEAQRVALQTQLDVAKPGRFTVSLGLKHATPKVEEAVAGIAAMGATQAIGLVLAPHFSALSIGEYLHRAATAAEAHGVAFRGITQWHLDLAYVAFLSDAVGRAVDAHVAAGRPRVKVVFTAHSLPARVVAMGDPYPTQLEATASAVAAAVGLPASAWQVGWQSAGRTPEPWLGPDLLEILATFAAQDPRSIDAVVVCPCGFTSDHLEVLYDIDIEAAHRADQLGLALSRTPVVNDDSTVFASLARTVVDLAGDWV